MARRSPAPVYDRPSLTNPQWKIYEAGWQPSARFRVAVCGRRFGKTFLATEELRRAASLAVKHNISTDNEIWYGAPTFKQGKRVFWKRLKKAVPFAWLERAPNETECSITLKSGHVIRVVGLDNYDALRGSGLWFFLGDEWQDAPPEAWTETIRPMLSTAGGHALFIGTPKGFNHFRDAYLLGQPGGDPTYRSFLYTTEDGGNVPPSEILAAQSQLDERSFRQEYRASFETYAGRVVYAFSRTDNVRPCAYNPAKPIKVGLDFNINPMSATIWQEDGDVSFQIDEIIMPTSNTDEMADELARRYGKPSFDPSRQELRHIEIYPDPAGEQRRTSAQGRTDIGILRTRGFSVMAMRSHPLVRDRLNVTNSRFRAADGTIRAFIDPKCRHSIEAYERLIYREGTNEPDKGSGFDHIVDGAGYYFFGRFSYEPTREIPTNHMGR